MQKKKTFMSVAILLAVLMLGIGYANISSISLNITGTAAASPDTANYVVKFTGTPSVSDENYASAEITGDHSAEITVTGLTAKGDSADATYTISNESKGLNALLTATTTNDNEEFFEVTYEFAETTLEAGNTTTVKVTVTLVQTPIDAAESANIGVAITATPDQPETTTEETTTP